MYKRVLLAGVAMTLSAAPAAVRAQEAAPAQNQSGKAESDFEASSEAIANADVDRLLRDRDYAARILADLDRLSATLPVAPEAALAIDNMRLLALLTLERSDEVRAAIDRMLARRPRQADYYGVPWFAALGVADPERAVAVVETASRNVGGTGWASLRAFLERETVSGLLHQLRGEHEVKRVRLAAALFHIGWPGDRDVETADFLRSILMEDRLRNGDDEAAAEFASGISSPSSILPMVVQTRYDAVFNPGQDRLEALRHSLEQRDRQTADALGESSDDVRRILDRMQYLRGLGRDAEALALVEPFLEDVPATVAAHEEGMWLANEAAYALLALGRNDEAVALMSRLVALPIADNPGLIGPSINHSIVLSDAGRYGEALDHALWLEREASQYASEYGKMFIASSAVCALAQLSRSAEAAPYLERMRAQSDDNPGALTQAYLCVGDMAAAEALMVRRLGSEEPESAILALQDYRLSRGSGQTGPVYDRLTALRERPAVQAALARVGRVLNLPLARTYWGTF